MANDPAIRVTHATREALAQLAATMRQRLGHRVTYDEAIKMLIDEHKEDE